MEQPLVTPRFPTAATLALFFIVTLELGGYGLAQEFPAVWVVIILGLFYIGYTAILKRDTLPLIFALLFFTAYHSLFLNINTANLPIALLFVTIFGVNSVIMWFLLHYATHLKSEHHLAYTIIAGFLNAQIITLFASMSRDWDFSLEIAAYVPAVFGYVFWRLACLEADSVLDWRQFGRIAVVVLILTLALILSASRVYV